MDILTLGRKKPLLVYWWNNKKI